MERRFAVRFEEMMCEAEVKPRSLEGALERLEAFVQPFAASLCCAAQRAARAGVPRGVGVQRGTKERGVDRLPARPGSTALAEVYRAAALGRSAADRGTGPAGGSVLGGGRRGAGLRSVGVSEARSGVRRRGAAVVWTFGKDRQLPGGDLSGVRHSKRACFGRHAAVSAQGMDEGSSTLPEGRRTQGSSFPYPA